MSIAHTIETEPAASQTVVLPDEAGTYVVPQSEALFEAEFLRAGHDLVLTTEGAASVRLPDYFRSEAPADIYAPDGSVLRGATVETLAGPIAPGQYAQVGNTAALGPIGQVEAASGDASVQRADGVVEELSTGMKIFQNDVVQTGDGGSLSVTFVDGTIFTLSASSRMVIDELVYDPNGSENSGTFSLIQGGFVFIAGQVAKTGGMDVNTPSATMGIRGTTVLAEIETRNGVVITEVSLTRDPDGDVGEIVLRNVNGDVVANITDIDSKWILTSLNGEVRQEPRTLADDAEDNLLIAEAVDAFRAAFARVDGGDTFVSLGDTTSNGTANDPGQSSSDELEVDSIDEPTGIGEEQEQAPEIQDQDDSFDEGNLLIDNGFDAPNISVAGAEDTGSSAPIAGVVSIATVPGQTLTFTLATPAANGTAQVNPDGSFTFVPDPNFNGTDGFSYAVTDGQGLNETGVVTVQVLPVNDAPVAQDAQTTVAEDGSVAGVIASSDIDGDVLSYTLDTAASNGTVVLTQTGAYTYTPAPNYSGPDSFVVQVSDGAGGTALASVTVSVTGISDPPQITTALAQGNVIEDGTGTAGGTLTATDADPGAILTWSGSSAGSLGSFAITAAGDWTYTLNQTAAQGLQDGQQQTETFTATVTDDDGVTAQIPVTITITGTGDAPQITTTPGANQAALDEDGATLTASGVLTFTDSDAGGSASWSGSAPGLYGSFVISAAGGWTYTLNAAAAQSLTQAQVVTESFTATVTDDSGATATDVVEIVLTGSNDAPQITTTSGQAAGALIEGDETTLTAGQLTATDADLGSVLTWAGSANGTYGTFAIDASGAWTYNIDNVRAEVLSQNMLATETFIATVTDDQGASQTQQVSVTITGTNDGPVVQRGIVEETLQNTDFAGTLIATDADSPGALVFAAGASGPINGTVSINTDGTYTYAPNTGFQGVDTFEFNVTDSNGATTTGTVTVEVESPGIGSNSPASVGISTSATAAGPSGNVAIQAVQTAPSSLNLAIAMDRSGSVSAQDWIDQKEAVAGALELLAAQFAGAATEVDVQIITFAGDVISLGPFDLQDATLPGTVRNLVTTGGATDWGYALNAAEDFFDAQLNTQSNFLLFISDGDPTTGNWERAFDDLTNTTANGYAVTVEAYGIGIITDLTKLSGLDPSPTFLNTPSDLSAALATSQLFNPILIDFAVSLEVDGVDLGVIADQTHPAVVNQGLNYDLPLAEIDGIETLLGEVNRFSVTVRFDLDGTPNTAELELFSTELFTPSAAAEVLTGLAESDLLIGGTMGDVIQGAGGNDVLLGLGGDDTIDGGAGQDVILGGAGDDTILITNATGLSGEKIDGGAGTDTLKVELSGDLTVAVLPVLDVSGIEAIDMANGLSNSLTLSLADVMGLSDTAHEELEALLGVALGDSAVILGDAGDQLTLTGASGGQFQASASGPVTDAGGNTLNIYDYVQGGNVLATLGVDDDIVVDTPIV